MDFWLDLRGLINPKPNQPLPLMTPFMQFIGSIGQLNGSLINSDFESPKKKNIDVPSDTEVPRAEDGFPGKTHGGGGVCEGPWGPGGMGGETGRGNQPGIWKRSKRRKNTGNFDVDWLQMLSELVGSGHF
jgi:hypothetical protein